MDQAAKAREAKQTKLAKNWESRLQRMGLGEQAGADGHILQYGAEYYPDTKPFNYDTEPVEDETPDWYRVMVADSAGIRFSAPRDTHFWPHEETYPNYRAKTVGGLV